MEADAVFYGTPQGQDGNLVAKGSLESLLMSIIQVMLHLQKNLMLTWNGENMLLMVEDFILN